MNTIQHLIVLSILTCCAGLTTGCVKLKQVITVMPDGSGKIELQYGLSTEQVKMARDSDVAPFKEVMPEVMQYKCSGLIAFTEPVMSEDPEDGYSYLNYTAYFDDINQLRIGGLGEGKPASYAFRRVGEGATFTVSNGTALSMLAGYKPVPERERERSREAMAGLALSEYFILPGKPDATDGITTEQNTAMLDLKLDDLIEGTGPVAILKGKNTLTLKIPKLEIEAAAIKAFKQERDAAVKAWNERQRENK